MRICSWCRTLVQRQPGTPYCEVMGYFFSDNPFQCERGNSFKGGVNQLMRKRRPKYEPLPVNSPPFGVPISPLRPKPATTQPAIKLFASQRGQPRWG
jgi:hypothetical protein